MAPTRRQLLTRTTLAALALAAGGARATNAAPAEIAAEWPGARLHGQGRLRFLGLHVYDIRLWTPEPALGPDSWAQGSLALEIEYARALVGRLIAERSVEEMRRAGPIPPETADRWLRTMTELFPDVKGGDRLTGVRRPEGSLRFFHNAQPRGEVRDAEFARRFVGIWLGDQTSEPALRERLLGKR